MDADYKQWATKYAEGGWPTWDDFEHVDQRSDYPQEVADLLIEFGLDAESLLDEIYARGGEPQH